MGLVSELNSVFQAGGRQLVEVCLSSLLSVILLVLCLLGYHADEISGQDVPVLTLLGKTLAEIEQKGGDVKGDQPVITEIMKQGQVISSTLSNPIQADQYPILRYNIEGLWAGTEIVFFWFILEDPQTVHYGTAPWSGNAGFVHLAEFPRWKGNIAKLGMAILGTPIEPIIIHSLELQPLSSGSLLRTVWSQWSSFEGLSSYSINYVVGSGVMAPLLSPVPTVAAWSVLSLVIYAGITLPFRRWDWRVSVVPLLLGWLILDIRWQYDLFHQLEETHKRYAGKSWLEKGLAAEDGELFKFIMEIKKRMPDTPQRIFLVTKRPYSDDKYTRLRATYQLLPHNVYGYQSWPPKRKYVVGDYVLMLGENPVVHYDVTDKKLLRWGRENRGGSLPVERVYQGTKGTLYQITGD